MTRLSIRWALAVAAMLVCAGVGRAQAPSITPTSLPNGEVGVPYGVLLNANDILPTCCTWTVTSGALPDGLSLGTGTSSAAIIIGTPTATGLFSFTIQADDRHLQGSQAYSVTINPPLLITTTGLLPRGMQGVGYSAPLTATGGTGSYTWSLMSVSPPAPWLSVSGASLTASAPLAGTYSVTVQVTDSLATVTSSALTLVIGLPPLSTTTTSLPSGEASAPYAGTTLGATGGTPPYHWAITSGALPAVLSLDGPSGAISGTLSPTATTATGIVFQVTDSASATASTAPLTLTVTPGPSITTGATLPQGEIGAAYSQNLAASGGSGGLTWSVTVGSLPAGLALSSGGVISGTPTAPGLGTTNFNVQVTDSAGGSATQAFSLTVIAGPTISTGPTLPSGTVNAPYSGVTLAASGGTSPYTWSITVGSLPAGMLLNGSTGAISGTPMASGTANFTVQVADAKSVAATKAFTLTIAGVLTITNAPTLPTGEVGASYSQTFTAAGGSPPYTFSISSGSLPNGLNPSGNTIVGIPTASGTFNFTVQVTDSASATANKQFSLNISASLAITTSPALPNGSAGVSYSVTLTAAGGTSPYLWLVTSGSLPSGLTLGSATGLISGTPLSAGTFTFGVSVTDSTSVHATQEFNLTIGSGLVITTLPQLPAGATGSAYSQTLIAAGGTAPYSWVVTKGTLPNGLTLSTTGTITGKPTANGASSFTIQVTDKNGATASEQFSLTIGAGLTITSGSTLPPGSLGQPYPALDTGCVWRNAAVHLVDHRRRADGRNVTQCQRNAGRHAHCNRYIHLYRAGDRRLRCESEPGFHALHHHAGTASSQRGRLTGDRRRHAADSVFDYAGFRLSAGHYGQHHDFVRTRRGGAGG